MPSSTYTTAQGEPLHLDLTPEESAWLAHFRIRAADPTVSVGDLTNEAYSDENPILAESPIPGRGWVTREVHARPVYRAILDVLYQKTVQETGGGAEARFTVTVAQAATELGISEGSVRQAMRDNRLPSMRKGRKLFTSDEAVAGYRVSNRGPQSRERLRRPERREAGTIRVKWGSGTGRSKGLVFHVDHDGEAVANADGSTTVTEWTRAFAKSTDKREGYVRFWELAPSAPGAGGLAEVVLGPFGVWGPFEVVRDLKGREAREAWTDRPRG